MWLILPPVGAAEAWADERGHLIPWGFSVPKQVLIPLDPLPVPWFTLPSFFFIFCSWCSPVLRLVHWSLVPQGTTLTSIAAETSMSPCTICVHIFILSHIVIGAQQTYRVSPTLSGEAGVYCESGSPWLNLANYKSEQRLISRTVRTLCWTHPRELCS